MKSHLPSNHGQALILIVFAAVALVGMTALAVDGGNVFSDHRHAQNAADAAALAAALAKVKDQDWHATGLERAASNGYDNNGTTNTVELYLCDDPNSDCGVYAGNDEYIQVLITSHVKTYFAQVVEVAEITNNVNAVAHAKPITYNPMFPGSAVVGLSPHDCKAITYQGNADTTITDGGIYVNSDCSDAAFFNHSSAAILTAPSLCSVGGVQYNPDALDVSSIQTGCEQEPYPDPQYIYPTPDCTSPAVVDGNTLNPGNWSGKFPPSGVTQLSPGQYCVSDGDFKLNAGDTLTGNGVFIYMVTGGVTWNGGATINLSSPTSGIYQGLLLYLPFTNSSAVTINGNSSSTFSGTILAPASDVSVLGTGATGLTGQILGYTVDLTGNSATQITYDSDSIWHAPILPKVQLSH
jgi:hypothetical protein